MHEALTAEPDRLDSCLVVLDGLDEMPEHAERGLLLEKLEELQPQLKLMVTSRPLPKIRGWSVDEASTAGFRLEVEDIDHDHEVDDRDWICEDCDTREKRIRAAYWCKGCNRDFCVACFKVMESCASCGKDKDTFVRYFNQAIRIAAQPQDLEAYINWRIDCCNTLRLMVQRTKIRDIRLEDAASGSEGC